MSNPDQPSPMEELAALHALDLLDETGKKELLAAAQRDGKIDEIVRDFAETAALLAHEAPEITPPPELRREIFRQLPTARAGAKVLYFSVWFPYAAAACLMILGISQALQILNLKSQLSAVRANADQLAASNSMIGLRLATLEAKDAAYASSQVLVAWDPYRHRGMVSTQNLPAPPAGHDYQLWVLDPAAPTPISAGLITASRSFAVKPVVTLSPGFAISLEPSGGRPTPSGPILFAIAPGT